jgi:hypothetical protein
MSLFNSLGNGSPLGNVMNLMTQFNQFRSVFQGDANQQIQSLVNSGKVDKDMYNNAYQLTTQLYQMFKGKLF